ncbi:DsbC family protein [Salinicola sp. RZ23]|uniref:DsbC family protein n=1 Tax=Salinicola sp. RZ23 TaxID=1949087 RepID=UPI000DA1E380|nr:DsbC family protein [Salinicola sp. RZ23]
MKAMLASLPLLALLAPMPLLASTGAAGTQIPSALRALVINGNSVTPDSVRAVEIQGPLYEVRLRSGEIFYSDAQGRRMIVGTLYDNAPDGLTDVTEQHSRQDRLAQLKALPPESTVSFPAQGEEVGQITVFTDTTCPYCEKLHQEIDQLTAAGVAVRYVPFPRAGSQSPAARQLAQVLCAESPTEAMDRAFQGEALTDQPTQRCQTAVDDGFQLGQRFGVKGTPTIVLPDGEIGEGYVPAEQLIQVVRGAQP